MNHREAFASNNKLTKLVLKHNPILVATHKFKVQQDNQRKGKGKGGLLYASVLAPNKCCDKGNVTNGWQEKQTNIAINVRLETFLYSAHNNKPIQDGGEAKAPLWLNQPASD